MYHHFPLCVLSWVLYSHVCVCVCVRLENATHEKRILRNFSFWFSLAMDLSSYVYSCALAQWPTTRIVCLGNSISTINENDFWTTSLYSVLWLQFHFNCLKDLFEIDGVIKYFRLSIHLISHLNANNFSPLTAAIGNQHEATHKNVCYFFPLFPSHLFSGKINEPKTARIKVNLFCIPNGVVCLAFFVL